MRWMQGLASIGTAALLLFGAGISARAEAVDVALVLAADVSRSITNEEFQLQRQGYARAITSAEVLKAIRAGTHGAIALTFVEWAGPGEQHVVVPWQVIRDEEGAQVFAAALLAAPRSFYGRTSISAALDFAIERLKESGVEAEKKVIDVSGDGTNNAGRPVDEARDAALATGVTINGIAIINDRASFGGYTGHTQPPGGLPNYYRENVVGGPGAFLLVAENFQSFGEAMTHKLLTEIAALPVRRDLAANSVTSR